MKRKMRALYKNGIKSTLAHAETAEHISAAEILPEKLLQEVQTYIDGRVLYIPKASTKKEWGVTSGARTFYQERNKEIRKLFRETLASLAGVFLVLC